jgi:hypothetical protein
MNLELQLFIILFCIAVMMSVLDWLVFGDRISDWFGRRLVSLFVAIAGIPAAVDCMVQALAGK